MNELSSVEVSLCSFEKCFTLVDCLFGLDFGFSLRFFPYFLFSIFYGQATKNSGQLFFGSNAFGPEKWRETCTNTNKRQKFAASHMVDNLVEQSMLTCWLFSVYK